MCEVFEEQLFEEVAVHKTYIMFCLPERMVTLNHIKAEQDKNGLI